MPVKDYSEKEAGGPGRANTGINPPTTPEDKAMSRSHLVDSIEYNRQHEEQHRAAKEKAQSELEAGNTQGPQYGFYRDRGPMSTVSDEGEVRNGFSRGQSEMDGRYFRSNNDPIRGGVMFEQTDEGVDEQFGSTGYPMENPSETGSFDTSLE